MSWDVIVVGGGPAGLLAAGRAAQLGARTLLLEKMEKPGRKLRITGKGRCNLTNMKPLEEHLQEIQPEPRFLRQAYGAFFAQDLVDLLAGVGLETTVERGARVFPTSGKAWDAAEALVAWARQQGTELRCQSPVEALLLDGDPIRGVRAEGRELEAAAVILATGGLSYPLTGSTGDGYGFARSAGHTITPLRPSLVALETRPAWPAAQGQGLRNIELSLWIEGRKQATEFGEATFTEKGLDGPTVLRVSRRVVDALAAGCRVELSLDLKPALDPDKLDARLLREISERKGQKLGDLLRGFLPPPLVLPFAQALGLGPSAPLDRITAPLRKRLVHLLKELRFEAKGHGSWERAVVTAGGVSLKEIHPATLASRKVAGLFFAGELLDLDANTGGYNLQIAFSTGWLAGEAAAKAALTSRGA